jgi:hypothetical protein
MALAIIATMGVWVTGCWEPIDITESGSDTHTLTTVGTGTGTGTITDTGTGTITDTGTATVVDTGTATATDIGTGTDPVDTETMVTCASNPCAENATCVDGGNGAQCECALGYEGNGFECTDIDECVDTANDCDPDRGACENTAGGYTCGCVPGYKRNSDTDNSCVDVNECDAGQDNCDTAVGECFNVSGGYECGCGDGYNLDTDSVSCADKDECAGAENQCDDVGGTCRNTVGSFECGCDTGYALDTDGVTCLNIDDCAAGAATLCNDHGTCIDGVDSHTCACNNGWTGDACEIEVVNCDGDPCGHGSCTDIPSPGSYTCACDPGWTGDACGISIDDCLDNLCEHGNCLDGHMTYTCDCASGWSGDLCDIYFEEFNCKDGIDNDGDSYTDCADGQCNSLEGPNGQVCEPYMETTCNDNEDNDGDGLVDCADDDCDNAVGGLGGQLCEFNGEASCDDGFDNDRNGQMDCPVVVTQRPKENVAVGGDDVSFTFGAPALGSGVYECRSGHVGSIDTMAWANCDGGDGSTHVHNPIFATSGLMVTEIRINWGQGDYSEALTARPVYVHQSLNSAVACAPQATDAAYFQAAINVGLPGDILFRDVGDVQLANPFIRIPFAPPLNTAHGVKEGDGPLEALSLRRRFKMDPTGKYILITRTWRGRRNSSTGCSVYRMRNHVKGFVSATQLARNEHRKVICEALVLNAEGAAVCLTQDLGGNPTLAMEQNAYANNGRTATTYNENDVEHFMWRKMKSGKRSFFSPKCYDSPDCASGTGVSARLYLPDYDLFFP